MKKLIISICATLLMGTCLAFGQLKLYNPSLVKIGPPSISPAIKAGLEVNLDTVFFNLGSKSLYIHKYFLPMRSFNVGGSTGPIGPIVTDNKMVLIRGTQNGSVQLGLRGNELFSVYSLYYYSSNSTGISSLSDRRYKTNIEDLLPTLSKINSLRPVKFDYIKTDSLESLDMENRRKNKVGFIAQELIEIFPEAVNYNVEEDIYTIDYSVLIPFLVKAIQEQQEQIESLKSTNK